MPSKQHIGIILTHPFQLVLLIVLMLVFWCDISPAAERNILYINSYHAELPWSQRIMQGIQRTLKTAPFEVRLHVEHLDTKRYPGVAIQSMVSELISKRLSDKNFDLVIVSDNNAFDFALNHREELFHNLPIVFCGVNSFRPEMIGAEQGIIGVAEIPSITETISVALQLHPNTKEIIVIGSTSTTSERSNLTMIEEALLNIPKKVLFTSWNNLSISDLEQRLTETAENQLILISGIILDTSGNPLSFVERTSFVRRHSGAPIYSFWEHNLGHGIVGGKLINAEDQGRLATSMAVSILSGNDPNKIKNLYDTPNQFMFDYNEMERFEIGIDNLPQGSKVINSPPTLTEHIRSYGFQLIILLLATIVILILWRFATAKSLNRKIMSKVGELEDSERKLTDIIDFLPDPTWAIDPNGYVIAWNKAVEELTGVTKEKIIGKGDYAHSIPFYGERRPTLVNLILNRDISLGEKYWNYTESGDLFISGDSFHPLLGNKGLYLSATAAALCDSHGSIVGAIQSVRDFTDRKKLEVELKEANLNLERLSITDSLTGIANRRHFDQALEQEYTRHTRSGAQLSIIMLDIDFFKQFNDSYGHVEGDKCLQKVAQVLRDRLTRSSDVPARYGGEEFICILPETGLDGGFVVAEGIRRDIEKLSIPNRNSKTSNVVTVSLGFLSSKCAVEKTPNELIKQVDTLLYQAKNHGRNCIKFGGSLDDEEETEKTFTKIPWEDSYKCGHQLIDSQHKNLLNLASSLYEAALAGSPKETIQSIMIKILNDTEQHFEDEENLLKRINYPDFDEHTHIHSRILTQGRELYSQYINESISVGDIFDFFLTENLTKHLIEVDQKYFSFVNGEN